MVSLFEAGDICNVRGNIDKEPLFKFGTWPYRIGGNSPCCGTGVNFPGCEALVGLDGKRRLVGRKIDMGCYECQALSGLSVIVK